MRKLSKKEIDIIFEDVERLKDKDYKEEKFKQIMIDFEYTTYIISSYGRIFNMNWRGNTGLLRELVTTTDKDGYKIIHLHHKGIDHTFKMHRLVAKYFINNTLPEIRNYVNHKNGIKDCNKYWNLEWVTNRENLIHAYQTGLHVPLKGEDIKTAIYTEKQIREACKLLELNYPVTDIIEITGLSRYAIHYLLRNKHWKHISKEYDFSNYYFGKDILKIRKICELLESNQYSQKEIADITGADVKEVNSILSGHSNKDISKDYDLSRFTKTRIKRLP